MIMNLDRPGWGRGGLLVVTGLLVCLCGPAAKADETPKFGAAANDAAYSADLVAEFEKAEFYVGYRPGDDLAPIDYVRKWVDWKDSDTGRQDSPLLVRLLGMNESYREYASGVIRQLSRLSDLPLVEPPPESDVTPNFVISVVKPERVSDLLLLWNVPDNQRKEFAKLPCVGLSGHANGSIMVGFIIIKDNLSEVETKHCIAEEATRALGFRAPDFQVPSVFSDAESGVIELSREDKVLVRVLYDKRITVAMSTHDTMAFVPAIISELVQRMHATGEEALYQH